MVEDHALIGGVRGRQDKMTGEVVVAGKIEAAEMGEEEEDEEEIVEDGA